MVLSPATLTSWSLLPKRFISGVACGKLSASNQAHVASLQLSLVGPLNSEEHEQTLAKAIAFTSSVREHWNNSTKLWLRDCQKHQNVNPRLCWLYLPSCRSQWTRALASLNSLARRPSERAASHVYFCQEMSWCELRDTAYPALRLIDSGARTLSSGLGSKCPIFVNSGWSETNNQTPASQVFRFTTPKRKTNANFLPCFSLGQPIGISPWASDRSCRKVGQFGGGQWQQHSSKTGLTRAKHLALWARVMGSCLLEQSDICQKDEQTVNRLFVKMCAGYKDVTKAMRVKFGTD